MIMARMRRLWRSTQVKFLRLKLLFCCRNSEEMQTWRCQRLAKVGVLPTYWAEWHISLRSRMNAGTCLLFMTDSPQNPMTDVEIDFTFYRHLHRKERGKTGSFAHRQLGCDPLFGDRFFAQVMTDHFFPQKHLWEPWVRVEDWCFLGGNSP